MRKRTLIASVATSLVAALSVPLAVRAAAGPTCTVNFAGGGADYTTIQEAVDDTSCSTIKVAKGDYIENVTITRGLTLKGAKAGSNVNSRTFDSANESTVTGLVTINAAGVTVDGFSLTNPGHGLGVVVKTAGNNAVIKKNIVDTVGDAAFASNGVGIYLETGPDNVKIEDNKISKIVSKPSAQGILIGDSTSGNPSLGIRVIGNTISDITSTDNKGAYGIQANNGASSVSTATGYTTIKIRNNTIKNLTGRWVHAIGLEGDTPNVVVTQNIISGLNATSPDNIGVFFEDNIFFFTGDVSRNSLAVGSTAVGIAVATPLTTLYPTLNVDGTCNWWGHKSGPGSVGTGSGSLVGPGVDFKPWLKSANLNSRCGGREDHDNDNHHWGHDFNH